jgi:hypothetical protein
MIRKGEVRYARGEYSRLKNQYSMGDSGICWSFKGSRKEKGKARNRARDRSNRNRT